MKDRVTYLPIASIYKLHLHLVNPLNRAWLVAVVRIFGSRELAMDGTGNGRDRETRRMWVCDGLLIPWNHLWFHYRAAEQSCFDPCPRICLSWFEVFWWNSTLGHVTGDRIQEDFHYFMSSDKQRDIKSKICEATALAWYVLSLHLVYAPSRWKPPGKCNS